MEINNVNDLSKIMQPVLVGLVDQLANRVYETLNFFLQSYYDSYNPVSYRRQYDFLRSAIKVKGRMSRGKAMAYVYIDTESMSNYYNATGYQVATWANEGLHGGSNVGTSPHVWDETLAYQKINGLSVTWFKARINQDGIKQIKKNLYNYFSNIVNAKSDNIMWTTFKDYNSWKNNQNKTATI